MVLKTLKVLYPYHFKELSTDEQVLMMRIWEGMFKDEPYKDLMKAVQDWSIEHKYMPSIAEIKEYMPERIQIQTDDIWHTRFGYSNDPIYYDDDFSETAPWDDIPKDIQKRMRYHCNPKEYAAYNAVVEQVLEVNPRAKVKFYGDEDTEFLKGKMTTWKYELERGTI